MINALGDQVFITPIKKEDDVWTGQIVDLGFKVTKFSTYKLCNWVRYDDEDIIKNAKFQGDMVHIISFENIRKIEGIY
jgi:hypothetical protein